MSFKSKLSTALTATWCALALGALARRRRQIA